MEHKKTHKTWNISGKNALKLIIQLIENILNDSKVEISITRLPIFLKKEYRNQNIKVKKGNAYRNINTYIKENYGTIQNFIKQNENIFNFEKGSISFKKSYLKDKEDYIFI